MLGVFISLARQTDDEGAEWKPVVPVENLHAFQDHITPLVCFVRIGLALHVRVEKTRAARLETDDRIDGPLF